jgi:hypothetical protein
MASEFIGYNVLVSLQTPPGGKLQGQVADVIGQNLLLHNGMMAENMWLLDPADRMALYFQSLSCGTASASPTIPWTLRQ